MIAKGTPHANGARLAMYMITGKDGERAELHSLRGFAEEKIVDAFRSVHIMARGTNCVQPFFHCQIRTPDGEKLTTSQWEKVADRIEKKLGLDEQPRAIAFHIKDGHQHMHVAWSRIDGDTMKAKALPFYKLRLKEICRELEIELGLTQVRNSREPAEPLSPRRSERDQAHRLGLNVERVRQAVRDAWTHSDSGAAFLAALAEKRMGLAKGDRRDFVAIDERGGIHALGKRLLGATAAEVRERLADLDPSSIPTIQEAREQRSLNEELEKRQGNAATATTSAGMVAQQAEAVRRHRELNPFLKPGREFRNAALTDLTPSEPDPGIRPSALDEKQQRIDERAQAIAAKWQQGKDITRER